MRTPIFCLSLLLVLATAIGCAKSGRIKDRREKQMVGDTRAGTALYDIIVKKALTKLIQDHQAKVEYHPAKGSLKVAFVGIENSGAEELRDHREAVYDIVEEVLVNAGPYTVLSRRYVEVATREAGLRGPEDIFLKAKRQAFMSNLQEEGVTPDYFLWGKMTTQTTKDHGGVFTRKSRERRYRYSMEMVNSKTGVIETKVSGDSDKLYIGS